MVSNAIIYINNESRLIDIIKSDMKQTLEEAAKQELISSYAVVGDRGGFTEVLYNYNAMLNMFRKGAEWKAKQSPWISVEERLPENEDRVLVLCKMKRFNSYFTLLK